MSRLRRSAQLPLVAVATTVALVAVVALADVAEAHVTANASATTGDATAVSFLFTHGCAGAPTTTLRVQLPEGASDVTPMNPPGWSSELTSTELRWSGSPIADGSPGRFTTTMRLTGTKGETVFLPTIQGCAGGKEETWIEKTTDPEAPNAAPRIVLASTAASTTTTLPPNRGTVSPTSGAPLGTVGGDVDAVLPRTGPGTDPTTTSTSTTTSTGSNTSTSSPAWWIALVVLAVLAVFALLAVLQRRRTGNHPEPPPS